MTACGGRFREIDQKLLRTSQDNIVFQAKRHSSKQNKICLTMNKLKHLLILTFFVLQFKTVFKSTSFVDVC